MQHDVTQLSTGATLLRVGMPGVKSVTSLLFSNTGSRNESEKEWGIAHFFEHMVFKGTPNYPDPQTLAAAIDGVGADFNAFTSREYTGYYVKSASEHLKLSLDVLTDMLLQPLLKQEDLERERGVIIEELNMYVDNPMHHVANQFEQMLWEGSGLSHDIIGTKETIQSVHREDFLRFLNKWYGLGNLTVVLAGDERVVMSDTTVELVERLLAKQVEGERVEGKQQTLGVQAEGFISGRRLLVIERPTEQAHLILGWPGLKRGHSRRHQMALFNNIIGGSMSSRLFTEVREKRGLCYYVHSDSDSYKETGFLGASAGVETKRVQEAIQVIRDEFLEVATGNKKITQQELERGKSYFAGKLQLSLESSQAVAQFYGLRQLLEDRIETPEEILAQIQRVTLADLQQLAADLVKPEELRLAVIGPYKQADFEQFIQTK